MREINSCSISSNLLKSKSDPVIRKKNFRLTTLVIKPKRLFLHTDTFQEKQSALIFRALQAIYGGAKQDRTADLLRARQALSQLSYSPIKAIYKNCVDLDVFGRRIACYASPDTTTSYAILVGLGGFEPPTSPLSGVRSNQLSYRPESAGLQDPLLSS